MKVVTRFAPSPTGFLHVGNVRTALISWLFARSAGGKFILRVDDTDAERSEARYVDAIKRDLEWLGLEWDELFFQSKRLEKYEEAKEKLIGSGRLYPCYETQEELALKKKNLLSRNLPPIYDRASLRLTATQKEQYEKQGVMPHWRFLISDSAISWNDGIRGLMNFAPSNLSDPVLIRADGSMTYTLASVVDDIEFGITNIIRGEDHLSNSAVHIQIFEALNAKSPDLAHLSLLTSKDQEISKRLGGFDIYSLHQAGIEPMAINSFLAKIGTSDAIYPYQNMQDLIKSFTLSKLGKSPSNYEQAELERLNAKLIHAMPYEIAKNRFKSESLEDVGAEFWEVAKYNVKTLQEINLWWRICNTVSEPTAINYELTKQAATVLPKEPWDINTWSTWIEEVKKITKKSGKELFMPIRKALTGLDSGPELKTLLILLGYEKTFARLNGRSTQSSTQSAEALCQVK
ncbi:MAG: glutamate--tRNA ligase [Candidatus Midichloria mitochondrii]|uniref:Glutamate--tRNA ligase n=1 Tax=Midichloria mitochondrii (strain IricVA) TaxID=696127 RepID=F7XX43_MIDMI|nr:glutamate--tRNA ligase [Candidatus Midichloria mitochondrii]AEI89242.1 glutamyl-tRNA synthetase [Candidatus Midichloria mitochondrii IricVA]MDJ1256612.1 glutamate--tRNA ligase [Candidatus Midichloria mitochondrii]MDJ1288349.1 glutamate--tRNA ligase [Candidatus Midichloria mitochondrii]MDJ1299187.1 glutamate--tRNA ligase [Candidatus Midichloria mitochondrii]MDJ1312789.1 glutamate--tRNA ligase [Candidatus Midichloria mitochondrii]